MQMDSLASIDTARDVALNFVPPDLRPNDSYPVDATLAASNAETTQRVNSREPDCRANPNTTPRHPARECELETVGQGSQGQDQEHGPWQRQHEVKGQGQEHLRTPRHVGGNVPRSSGGVRSEASHSAPTSAPASSPAGASSPTPATLADRNTNNYAQSRSSFFQPWQQHRRAAYHQRTSKNYDYSYTNSNLLYQAPSLSRAPPIYAPLEVSPALVRSVRMWERRYRGWDYARARPRTPASISMSTRHRLPQPLSSPAAFSMGADTPAASNFGAFSHEHHWFQRPAYSYLTP